MTTDEIDEIRKVVAMTTEQPEIEMERTREFLDAWMKANYRAYLHRGHVIDSAFLTALTDAFLAGYRAGRHA